jgi:hypothetical protein
MAQDAHWAQDRAVEAAKHNRPRGPHTQYRGVEHDIGGYVAAPYIWMPGCFVNSEIIIPADNVEATETCSFYAVCECALVPGMTSPLLVEKIS